MQNIKEPTLELSQELYEECGFGDSDGRLAVGEGGVFVGQARLWGGAGNLTVVVDETADLKDAATKIRDGRFFDNATSCSSRTRW